jgi:serine protease Do
LEAVLPATFLELKERIDVAPGALWTDLDRATAEEVSAVLAANGVGADLEPAGGDTEQSRRRSHRSLRPTWPQLVAAGALVVLGGLALIAMLDGFSTDTVSPPAQPADSAPLPSAEIGRRFERAAVHLQCADRLGAGFFVTPELVVTNEHVLCDGPEIQVETVDGARRAGRVVERDEEHDLAVVRVVGVDAQPLPLGDATPLQRGDPVFAMGSPLGLDFTLSQGIVSHPDRVLFGVSYVQIDASVHPGNSGGALVDGRGRAVGVVSMQVRGSSDLGFAVPLNYLSAHSGLLGQREPWFDTAAWATRLTAAEEAEQAELEAVRSQLDRPLLVAASLVRPGAVVAVVLRASDRAPASESFELLLRVNEQPVCAPRGRAIEWQRWTPDGVGRDSRQSRWLAKHGLAAQLWAAAVHLEMTGCPGPSQLMGAFLELDGAAESASVVRIERGR